MKLELFKSLTQASSAYNQQQAVTRSSQAANRARSQLQSAPPGSGPMPARAVQEAIKASRSVQQSDFEARTAQTSQRSSQVRYQLLQGNKEVTKVMASIVGPPGSTKGYSSEQLGRFLDAYA